MAGRPDVRESKIAVLVEQRFTERLRQSIREAMAKLRGKSRILVTEREFLRPLADRFIVATALRCEAPLISKDRLMRSLRFVEMIWWCAEIFRYNDQSILPP